MIRVGLTGNVASGKSTVARVWQQAGVSVVSADDLAREAVLPGSPGLAAVRRAFGEGVLDPRGALDRERVRAIVFADPSLRRILEAILHPRIAELRRRWMEARGAEGADLAVSEVPLLFETGLEEEFDRIVVVEAPAAVREERLVRERGLSREEARRIMAAQGDPELKRARADHVLVNDGTLEELEEAARALLPLLMDPPRRGPPQDRREPV